MDGLDIGSGFLDFFRPTAREETIERRLVGFDAGLGRIDLGLIGFGLNRRKKLPLRDPVALLDLHSLNAPADIEGEIGLANIDIAKENDLAIGCSFVAPMVENGIGPSGRHYDDH